MSIKNRFIKWLGIPKVSRMNPNTASVELLKILNDYILDSYKLSKKKK